MIAKKIHCTLNFQKCRSSNRNLPFVLLSVTSFVLPSSWKVQSQAVRVDNRAVQQGVVSVTRMVLLALETGVPLLKLTDDSAMLSKSSFFGTTYAFSIQKVDTQALQPCSSRQRFPVLLIHIQNLYICVCGLVERGKEEGKASDFQNNRIFLIFVSLMHHRIKKQT